MLSRGNDVLSMPVAFIAMDVMSRGGLKRELGMDVLSMVKMVIRSWQAKGSA